MKLKLKRCVGGNKRPVANAKLVLVGISLSLGMAANAATRISAIDGVWGDTATWLAAVPVSGDTAIVRDGYSVLIGGFPAVSSFVRVGPDSTGGTLNITAGSLTVGTKIEVGVYNGGSGLIDQSGGTVVSPSLLLAAPVTHADAVGLAEYNISGGSLSLTGDFIVGGNADGVFSVSGTTATITGNSTSDIYLDRFAGDHKIAFALGAEGISSLSGFDVLGVNDTTRFVVDATAYAGDSATFHLIEAATVSGTTTNFTVTGVTGALRLEGDGLYLDVQMSSTVAPATIVSWTSISNNVMQMVVDAPSSASSYSPKTTTDLVNGIWTNVPHSKDGLDPFVITNLAYSTAIGTNEVIYVQATNAAAFFGIGE